jgi:succinate dehydrogenase / fumarate reductase cytochrome b subunit
VSEQAPVASDVQNPLKKHAFLLRRLHSLSGIVPVGLFVCVHLFTNFQLLVGDYQHEVEFIHSLPALLFMEITIWGSIAFHAILGLVYTFQGRSNVSRYPYMDNWRYTLQRITGIIALVFIFVHVSTLRWRWNYFGLIDTPFYVAGPEGQPLVSATTAAALQASLAVFIFYIIGTFSVVYHWCNGLWTAAISWGLTASVPAQKRWGYVCAGLAIVLSVFSIGALVAGYTRPLTEQEKAWIQQTHEAHKAGQPILHKADPNFKAPAASLNSVEANTPAVPLNP